MLQLLHPDVVTISFSCLKDFHAGAPQPSLKSEQQIYHKLHNLPRDVLQCITRFLHVHETKLLRQTCRALRDAPLGPLGVTRDHTVRCVELRNIHALRCVFRFAPTPRALIWAAFRCDTQLLDILIPISDPTFNGSQALVAAVESGSLECCARLLPLSDPLAGKSSAFRLAAKLGHLDIVRLLSPFANHSDLESYALRSAAAAGHTPVVRFLLSAGSSDPTICNSVALRHAARNGHADIVAELLPYTLEPTALMGALVEAAGNGHTACVLELLPHCDVRTGRGIAMRKATAAGHSDVAQVVLALSNNQATNSDTAQPIFPSEIASVVVQEPESAEIGALRAVSRGGRSACC
jgi:Ankyrin repeats (3 copies)